MLYKLKFTLPSVRVIQNWRQVINLRTGTQTSLYKKLATKAKLMSKEAYVCTVIFDKIILSK